MEHDFLHLRHRLFCAAKTRRRSPTSSNPQPSTDPSHYPVDARFHDYCHCHSQHFDLCDDVQSTARALEADLGSRWSGEM